MSILESKPQNLAQHESNLKAGNIVRRMNRTINFNETVQGWNRNDTDDEDGGLYEYWAGMRMPKQEDKKFNRKNLVE